LLASLAAAGRLTVRRRPRPVISSGAGTCPAPRCTRHS